MPQSCPSMCRCMNSSGDFNRCVVPSRQGVFSFRHHLSGGVGLHALVGQQPSLAEQVAGDHAVHHLQHNRHQLGSCSQQQAQGDRKRKHPLAHRHMGDDVVDQVRRRLRHAPGSARRAEPARRLQLKASSLSCPQSPQRRRWKPWARMPHSRKASVRLRLGLSGCWGCLAVLIASPARGVAAQRAARRLELGQRGGEDLAGVVPGRLVALDAAQVSDLAGPWARPASPARSARVAPQRPGPAGRRQGAGSSGSPTLADGRRGADWRSPRPRWRQWRPRPRRDPATSVVGLLGCWVVVGQLYIFRRQMRPKHQQGPRK